LAIVTFAISFLAVVPNVHADLITVDFDALDATAPEGVTGSALDSYLAGYGISISNVFINGSPPVPPADSYILVLDDRKIYGGTAVVASSVHNIMTQGGSNDPVSFQLNFSSLVDNFGFTRPKLTPDSSSGITHPWWRAEAYDASNNLLGSMGENHIGSYSDVPAYTFTLPYSDIDHVIIKSNNVGEAFSAVLIDDIKFEGTPIPEPATMLLLGSGLIGLAGFRRKKFKK